MERFYILYICICFYVEENTADIEFIKKSRRNERKVVFKSVAKEAVKCSRVGDLALKN